jgi:hypothetical protein
LASAAAGRQRTGNGPAANGQRTGNESAAGVASTSGYSGTPLAKKLGIAAGHVVHWVDAPAGLRDWLAPLPPGVRFTTTAAAAGEADLVHAFFTERAALARHLAAWRGALADDVVLWVSWPKKSAKVPTDITEDVIRAVALPLGFVDVKVCAVREVWSGLKLVVRKELRAAARASGAASKLPSKPPSKPPSKSSAKSAAKPAIKSASKPVPPKRVA